MASTILEISPGLIHLFRDVSSKLSRNESEDVVKSSKTIYGEQFYSLENQDLISCFIRLYELGYVSETKLTLVKDFVASQSNKEDEIKEMVENFMASRPPRADPEKELHGRSKDFKNISGKLRTNLTSVVNLHGSAGVGKTRLAKEISSKCSSRSYVFDLREAKDTRELYLNVLNSLELTVPVGQMSLGYVVDKVIENVWKDNGSQPVLFVFDNVEHFTEGKGKEGLNLKKAFIQFLERFLNMKALRILLTSRTEMKVKNLVDDYELEPLNNACSEKILFSKDFSSFTTQKDREKLLHACKGKPLLLKGVIAILSQRRKSPSDLISELEKHTSSEEKMGTPVTSKAEEDAKENPFDFQAEGIDEIQASVIKEMFHTLPSDCLKLSAVLISLFRGPFTASTAAQVLGINLSEAVAQLEGLVTSEIISVVSREAKELMYDIHPLLRKYADSIKSDAQFRESYTEAKRRFQAHFVSKMKVIAELIEPDYVKAYNLFQNERPNYEFAIDISLLPEFFSIPSEFHDITLIASVFIAMLSNEKQTELFHSWADMCKEDAKSGSLSRAYFRCWEARQVLGTKGTAKAFEVLEQAASSLGQVQDHTTEPFKLTQGLFLYFKGEIYCQMEEYKKALECLQSSLDLTEEIHKIDTNLARCYKAIGNCYNGLKKPEEALWFFNKALKMREELSGSEYHYDMPVYKSQIGTVHEAQGEFDRAVECYKDALRLLHELKISGYEDEAVYHRNIANVYVKQGKFKDAIAPSNEAYNIRKKRLGNHPETVRSIYQLGIIQANLGDFDKALEWHLEAWEMEKSLDAGNHSAVWTLLIDVVIDYLDDDTERETFRQDAVKFCQCLWKETKGESSVEHKKIIDTLMKLLGDEKENRGVKDEDEKEALGFFDQFQKATDEDFFKEFDGETDNQTLNEMLESRIKFLEKITDLCERLEEHKKRAEQEMNKLTLYSKALLKAEFVGWKGNEKSTLKRKVEQLYQELNCKETITKFRQNLLSVWQTQWEQGKGIGETKESRVARQRTIKGILQLCQELKKEKLGRQYGEEALRFYEDLWTAQYDEMDVPEMKKFLRGVKDLASSVGDHDRVELYQDALQDLINTGKKPAPLFRQKESQAPSYKRLFWTLECDSDEKEEIEVGSEETEVTSEQDIERDAEADEGSEEEVEVNSEEELKMTSEAKIGVGGGFTKMENSCTVIHRFAAVLDFARLNFVVVRDLVCDLYRRLMAQWAGFKACLCRRDAEPSNYFLLNLSCYPNYLKSKVKDLFSIYDVVLQGEGTSLLPLCGKDMVFVDLSESFIVDQTDIENFCLKFLENDSFENGLPVRIKKLADVKVKFFKLGKDEVKTELCTVSLIPISPVQLQGSPGCSSFRFLPHGNLPKQEETMKKPNGGGTSLQIEDILNVTLVATEWGSSKGGLSTLNRELAKGLAQQPNVSVTILVPKYNESEKLEAQKHKVNLATPEKIAWIDPITSLSFPRKDHQIDIVVGHGQKIGPPAQAIASQRNCKRVHIVHTNSEELAMFKKYPQAISEGEEKHQVEVNLCKTADMVLAIGPKLTDTTLASLRRYSMDVVSLTPGIFSEFSELKQASTELANFRVLLFGRGDPEDFELKGYGTAAKAVAGLKDDYRYRLIFVGAQDGKGEEVKNSLIECGISPNQLTVRGYIESRQGLADLFCEADLAIMPSRTEGFGLAALEALSAGLPILVSDNSGFGEALFDVPNGSMSVVDSCDVEKWREAIRRAKEKPRHIRLKDASDLRAKYGERYKWEEQCANLVKRMCSIK